MHEWGVPESRAYAQAHQSRYKAGTIRNDLLYLRAAANHAVKWRRLAADKMPQIEYPPKDPPRQLWLFHDELEHLRAAATGRAKAFIEIAYWTASRRAAVERLTWFQVSLDRNRINLAQPGERESRKRRPVIPIPPELRPTLERLKAEATSEYVLGHPGDINGAFYVARRAAGLQELPARDQRPTGLLSPHVLRHSRATHLLQQGVTPWAVANLLGDRLETVVRNYGHHCPDYLGDLLGENQGETHKSV